jgi:hypothetical protein
MFDLREREVNGGRFQGLSRRVDVQARSTSFSLATYEMLYDKMLSSVPL